MRHALAAILLALSHSAAALEAGGPLPAVPLATLEDGKPVESLRGKVVYVDFWASWCVPCRLSMPTLDGLYRRHKDRGFVVVGVNKDNTVDDARRFLAKVPVSFVLVQDLGDAVARAFDVKAMPSGYLVDRKGVVRRVHRGFTTETGSALAREIESLLQEPA